MDHKSRVSFSANQPAQNHELVQMIKEEAVKSPTSFNLATRNLMKIPPEIGLLRGLDRLGLNNNKLLSLPQELANLQSLRYLNLKSNLFKEFPPVLAEMSGLQVLDLSRNSIKKFPEKIGAILNIRVLSVSFNEIKQLPKYFAEMKNLTHLRLDHNPLIWPPDYITASNTNALDHTDWLDSMRDFISSNDPPKEIRRGSTMGALTELEKSLPDSTNNFTTKPNIKIPDALSIAEKGLSETRSPSSPFLKAPPQSCQDLLPAFLASYHANIDILSKKYPSVDGYLTIMYIAVELYTCSKTFVTIAAKTSKSNDLRDKVEHEWNSVNFQVLSLILCIKGFLSLPVLTLENQQKLHTDITHLILTLKSLIQVIHTQFVPIIMSTSITIDWRISSSLYSNWSRVNRTLHDSIKRFGELDRNERDEMNNHQYSKPFSSIEAKRIDGDLVSQFKNLETTLLKLDTLLGDDMTVESRKLVFKSIVMCRSLDIGLVGHVIDILEECKEMSVDGKILSLLSVLAMQIHDLVMAQ